MPITLRSGLAGNTIQTQSFPVGLDATKTFFVDQNRNPCFALGEDAAELPIQLPANDIEFFLSDRASRGINFVWFQGLENIIGASPPNNVNSDAPFTGGVDFVNPNISYWNYVDRAIQRAAVWGMTVMFNPMFFGLDNSSGYRSSVMGSSDAVLQTFADYIAGRFGNCGNVMFLIGGDSDPNNATGYAKLNTFATRLKLNAPNRLMTHEASRFIEVANGGGSAPNGGYSSVDAHTIAYGSVQSWLDFNWVYQTSATCASGAQRCYSQGKPCLLGEDWYESDVHAMTSLGLRTEAYGAVLGGCTLGRLSGNGPIWSFNATGGGSTTPPWQTQLSSQGSADHQRVGKLFRSRAWQKLVPDIAGTTMTVGAAGGSVCARTSDGQSIIAYLPSSQTVTIDMSKITDGGSQAACNWYNPQTGVVSNIGTFANSSTRNFTSPDSNDWVLVVDSTAANLRVPGT